MRLLHVSGGRVYGGIERMLATFAAAGVTGPHQCFAVPPEGRLWSELRASGVEVAALPSPRASRPLSIVKARRVFDDLLRALDPDTAIFHGSWTHAMFATVARERGVGVAFWQHAPIVQPRWPDRWAARTPPDVLIANSRFTASFPAFLQVPARVIYCPVTAPPPVSAVERAAYRESLGAGPADTVVLMAARLEMFKGHHVLVEAARLLDRPDIAVWIAGGVQDRGEQAYLDRLEREVVGVRSPVRLLGDRRDVPTLMACADIYCQPNVAPEPFGVAIAEAMRAALPCVVSNAGGAAELVDGTCGVLTNPGDAAGVAAAIASLAANPVRREAMGRAAAERALARTDPASRIAELGFVLSEQPAHAS